ncbi:MAG TPA: cytochrome D1 domain-containing protein [Pseudacidobacterium sp.]|jgi:YVTN family beta-propeller protein|nr:cytochrome D1 domain-containing protein [Pseudacidobacterium sp.]
MTKKIFCAIAVCSFLITGSLWAQSTPTEALLVLSKVDQTLSIVDPVSLKVVARIPVGKDPHEVIASTDGKFAYVSNYGYGAYNTLAVVDLIAHKALPAVELGPLRGPHGLAFADGKLWFTAEVAKSIARYDPEASKVDWILGIGQNRTHMIFVSPDSARIVTTNVNSGTVSIIDKISVRPPGPVPGAQTSRPNYTQPLGSGVDWTETVVPVGKGPEGFDISPDGKEIWTGNSQDGTVSVIDTATKKVIQTIPANVPGSNRVKFTPDGKLVFISSLHSPDVTVFDAATRKEVKRIPVGHASEGILVQPDGARVFVSTSPDDYVTVIDTKSLQVTGRIEAGHEPDGLAWAVQR